MSNRSIASTSAEAIQGGTDGLVSIVIPAVDEEASVQELHRSIARVCKDNSIRCQIIFVDDGSVDGTWKAIQQICCGDRCTEAIRFRRNFGKAAALTAGIEASRGSVVVTIDADLQDDPEEIPRILQALEDGLDVVSGWKRVRYDPLHKVIPSRIFNWLVSRLTGVKLNDHNCGFKGYRREVFDEIELYGELHRFVPVLAGARGYRVGEIEVNHRPRLYGKSKYGLSRLVKGTLDLMTVHLLTGYSSRPQHLIGAIGLLFFAVGAVGMIYLTTAWVLSRMVDSIPIVHLHETAIFYYCILSLLLGSQFLLAGLMSELIVSRTMRASERPFSVAETISSAEPRLTPSTSDTMQE